MLRTIGTDYRGTQHHVLMASLFREMVSFPKDISCYAPDRYARIRDGEFEIGYCRHVLKFEKINGKLVRLLEVIYPDKQRATEFAVNPFHLLTGREYDDLVKTMERF